MIDVIAKSILSVAIAALFLIAYLFFGGLLLSTIPDENTIATNIFFVGIPVVFIGVTTIMVKILRW